MYRCTEVEACFVSCEVEKSGAVRRAAGPKVPKIIACCITMDVSARGRGSIVRTRGGGGMQNAEQENG